MGYLLKNSVFGRELSNSGGLTLMRAEMLTKGKQPVLNNLHWIFCGDDENAPELLKTKLESVERANNG